MTADTFAAVFHRYVDEVLATDSTVTTSSRERVDLPSVPAMAPADLRRVLDNPAVLITPLSTHIRDDVARLFTFAKWLDEAQVPDELRSRAARLRFAIWSFPARVGWPAAQELHPHWLRAEAIDEDWILPRARAAQQEWKRFLDAWEDDPWLAARHLDADDRLEDELRWLNISWPHTKPPAGHTARWPDGPKSLDLGVAADSRRVAADSVERWLERGSLLRAATGLAPGTWLRWPALGVFPLLATAVVATLLWGDADKARWFAVGLLGLGLLAATLAPTRFTMLGLLRLPAAAMVGLGVLVSLTSRWWISPNGVWIGGALLIGAALYLAFEARQHGARWMTALGRGTLIMLVGALHAAVLSIAALGFVVPAMGERGECLNWRASPWHPYALSTSTDGLPKDSDSCAKVLRTSSAAAPAGTVLLMTGWSLSFGLAAQILWDDRPVTSPLGRLRRTRGGT